MTGFDGRWLRRVLAVGLVATLPMVSSPTPVAAAGNGCQPSGSWDIRWTGAAGDEAWSNAANWEPANGEAARTPIATDSVCIDTSVGGAVESGSVEVDRISLAGGPTDPPVRLFGSITVQEVVGNGPVRFVDDATVTGLVFRFVDLAVDADATVDIAGALRTEGMLDVAGQLLLHGSSTFAAVTVRPSGDLQVEVTGAYVGECGEAPYEYDYDRCSSFTGTIDIQTGGSASVAGDGVATRPLDTMVVFSPEATLVGGTVALRNIGVEHEAPFPLTLQLDMAAPVYLAGLGSDSTLDVQRSAGSTVPFLVDVFLSAYGHLSVTGQPGPAGPVDVIKGAMQIDSEGSVAFDGVDARFSTLENEGTLRLDRTVVQPRSDWPLVLMNTGRLEIGARQGPEVDPLRASAVFTETAELLNLGEIVAVDPSAELTLGGYTRYDWDGGSALGTLTVPVSAVVPVAHMPFVAEVGDPLPVPWMAWGAGGIGVEVGGVTDGAVGRVDVEGLLRDVGGRRLVVIPGDGYEPCAGERWPVATFEQAALGYRLPTGGTSSVPGAERSTIAAQSGYGPGSGWSVVASDRPGSVVATVTGTSAEGCSTPAGGRFVSALYVEGTGRVPTDAEYDLRAGRSATTAGRLAQARVVLKGSEARGHLIDEQYRRILDRPVTEGSQAVWSTRLAGSYWTVDRLRGALYGSTEFWDQNGASLSSVTNAVYQRELGRDATAAEQSAIAQQVNGGASRIAAFTAVMGTAEADITTGAAMVQRWWARDATLFEAFYVGALLHRGDAEHLVAADLAAGLPLS